MLISELTFPHLLAEREARLTRELEQRRVVQERLGEAATPRARRNGVDVSSSERMPRAGLEAIGPRAAETCTA